MAVQPAAPESIPVLVASDGQHSGTAHTSSTPCTNYQLNQERHLHLLQSQLEGHKLRADELEKQCERLTAEVDNAKERYAAAGHRQFQVHHVAMPD